MTKHPNKPIMKDKALWKAVATLEALFAEIEIYTLRKAFRQAQEDPEKIPVKLKPLIAMHNFPEIFVAMIEKNVA